MSANLSRREACSSDSPAIFPEYSSSPALPPAHPFRLLPLPHPEQLGPSCGAAGRGGHSMGRCLGRDLEQTVLQTSAKCFIICKGKPVSMCTLLCCHACAVAESAGRSGGIPPCRAVEGALASTGTEEAATAYPDGPIADCRCCCLYQGTQAAVRHQLHGSGRCQSDKTENILLLVHLTRYMTAPKTRLLWCQQVRNAASAWRGLLPLKLQFGGRAEHRSPVRLQGPIPAAVRQAFTRRPEQLHSAGCTASPRPAGNRNADAQQSKLQVSGSTAAHLQLAPPASGPLHESMQVAVPPRL